MKTDCLISLDELMGNVSMTRHDLTALIGQDTAAWIEKVADRMQQIHLILRPHTETKQPNQKTGWSNAAKHRRYGKT